MQSGLYNLLTFFFFVFGSLLGSFCNVVILRMAAGKSVIFPPSSCPACSHRLFAKDLAPVFSWLFLKGRCRYCGAPISPQYPLVEAMIAAIVGFSFIKAGLTANFIGLSASLTIWFAAGVIFLRNEVGGYQPFFWAVFYTFILNYFLCRCRADAFIYAVIGAVVAFVLVMLGKEKPCRGFAWFCLAAIFTLYMVRLSFYAPLAMLPALLLNLSVFGRKYAHILFFITQILAIAVVLAQPLAF